MKKTYTQGFRFNKTQVYVLKNILKSHSLFFFYCEYVIVKNTMESFGASVSVQAKEAVILPIILLCRSANVKTVKRQEYFMNMKIGLPSWTSERVLEAPRSPGTTLWDIALGYTCERNHCLPCVSHRRCQVRLYPFTLYPFTLPPGSYSCSTASLTLEVVKLKFLSYY